MTLLQLTEEQELFQDTTAKFLADKAPVATLRALRHDAAGFDPAVWRQGADLGWTSFLASEEHGIADLAVIAYEFGRAAAPGPLLPTNVVVGALASSGSHADVLDALLDGSAVAGWALQEPGRGSALGDVSLTIRRDGDELVLSGTKRPVESAGQATHLLVTGRSPEGLTQVLVPTSTPGLTVTPMQTVDLTRRFAVVTFDDVRVPADAVVGALGGAEGAVAQQLLDALVISNAESVGAMQTAFDVTVQWAFDRFSFGRPLASYQALKHAFADMKLWLEGAHAISAASARALAAGDPDAPSLVSAAKCWIGVHGTELVQECVQLHGGLGVTFEHDIHLYLRRQTVNHALLGTVAQHRLRLTELHEQKELAA